MYGLLYGRFSSMMTGYVHILYHRLCNMGLFNARLPHIYLLYDDDMAMCQMISEDNRRSVSEYHETRSSGYEVPYHGVANDRSYA